MEQIITITSPWQRCHELDTRLSGWLTVTDYWCSCSRLLLRTEPAQCHNLWEELHNRCYHPPNPVTGARGKSQALIIMLFYSERAQHADEQVVSYFKMAKAFFVCFRSWPGTQKQRVNWNSRKSLHIQASEYTYTGKRHPESLKPRRSTPTPHKR